MADADDQGSKNVLTASQSFSKEKQVWIHLQNSRPPDSFSEKN